VCLVVASCVSSTTNFSTDTLVKWIKLTTVKSGLGPAKIQKLLTSFNNNLDTVFDATKTELLSLPFLNENIVDKFEKLKNADDTSFHNLISICEENKIKIVPFISSDYPVRLKLISSPPLTLYLNGNYSLLTKSSIAIVGTRIPSPQASEIAYKTARYLGDKKIVIVSGGALGIDTQAHKGSLDSQLEETICVTGSGFFKPYPLENKSLFQDIVNKNGLLISENTPAFSGADYSFAFRNRITSGISDSVFLVATNAKGGGMDQAKKAYNQKKQIFVPKLNLNILPNEGIKIAIRDYAAIEIDNPEELLEKTKNRQAPSKRYIEN